ncbi:MAG: winged helix-turn-helix transcriptional regulator [Nitrososphaera sp.]
MTAHINAGCEAPFQLCDAVSTSEILGRKWTLRILATMNSTQAMRFTELKRALPGVSGTMLSKRLSELERQGVITKKIHGSVPPRVEYTLTESARDLVRILQDLCIWQAKWNSSKAGKQEGFAMNPLFITASS